MKKFVLFGLLMPLLLIAQNLKVENYNVTDGLPQSEVLDLYQDAYGYLWIGTMDGVARYDGEQFEIFGQSRSMVGNQVHHFLHQSDSSFFTFSRRGYNFYQQGGFDSLYRFDQELTGIGAVAIMDDVLYISPEDGGLLCIKNGQQVAVPAFNGIEIIDLFADADGLLGFYSGGVFRIDKTGEPSFKRLNVPAIKTVTQIKSDFLLGTGKGVFHFQNGEVQKILEAANVLSLAYSSLHGYLVGTDAGVSLFRNDESGDLKEVNKLLVGDKITNILVDKDEVIWLSSPGRGLFKLYQPFVTKVPVGLRSVLTVTADDRGIKWVGTRDGNLIRIHDDGIKAIQNFPASQLGSIQAALADHEGNLWLGTKNRGLFRFRSGEINHIPVENGSTEYAVTALHQDSSHQIWVGTDAGLKRIEGQKLRDIGGLLAAPVSSLFEYEGKIMAGTASGITLYQNGQMEVYPLDTKHRGKEVVSIDANERYLAIAFADHGVLMLDKNKETCCFFFESAVLSSGIVHFVKFLSSGDLLVGTSRGIDRIKRLPENDKYKWFLKRKIVAGETNRGAVYETEQGEVFVGAINGLLKIDPSIEIRNEERLNPHVTGIRFFLEENRELISEKGAEFNFLGVPMQLSLPHHQNHISFDFNGINQYFNEQKIYEYYLEGFDQHWSPPTKEHSAVYSNLPPGKYRFQLKASLNGVDWVRSNQAIEFTILAPFWQTGWFVLLLTSAFFILFAGGNLLWIRNQQAQKRKLESLVEIRTHEIKELNDELEKKVIDRTLALEKYNEKLRREIAGRIRIESKLKDYNSKFRLMSENIKDFITLQDRNGLFVFVSDSVQEVTGYSSSELIGKDPSFLLPREYHKTFRRQLKEIVEKEQFVTRVYSMYHKNGDLIWVEIIPKPIYDEQGNYNQFVVTARNITARVELEDKIRKIRKNLARDFHDDLGNKLAVIRANASLLKLALNGNDSKALRAVKQIDSASNELYTGTKDFIWTLDPESNELFSIISYIKDFAEDYFQHTGINFVIDHHLLTEDLKVNLPEGWSRQIILIFKEAITNIYKHSRALNVYFQVDFQSKDQFRIILWDDGVGMNEERSNGRGLYNMNYRAKTIGCEIEVSQSPGNGTKIIFEACTSKTNKYELL